MNGTELKSLRKKKKNLDPEPISGGFFFFPVKDRLSILVQGTWVQVPLLDVLESQTLREGERVQVRDLQP